MGCISFAFNTKDWSVKCTSAKMPQIRRILFPIDFSEQTRATAPLVNAMASRFDAQVVLLNVVPMPSLASSLGLTMGLRLMWSR